MAAGYAGVAGIADVVGLEGAPGTWGSYGGASPSSSPPAAPPVTVTRTFVSAAPKRSLSAHEMVIVAVPARLGMTVPSGATEATAGSEDEYTVSDADALCNALPDEIEFVLMNCSVAYSLLRAKEIALAEGKAILRVSGTVGDTNTQAVLDYIYARDTNNAGDFTNRFVYLYSDAKTKEGDMSPSIGVFLPEAVNPADRWRISNGMLAYDWNMDAVSDLSGLQTRVQTVLDVGWDLYSRRSGNTVLAITAPTFENLAPPCFTISYAGPTNTISETPAAGAYTNAFVDGQQVTVASANELTNETAGVVLACSGWTLTNETTGAVQKGQGRTATFAVATNETVSLNWSVTTNAVYVTVAVDNIGGGGRNNTVTPGTGWYPYGTRTTFTATPEAGYYVAGWTGGKEVQSLAEGVSAAGLQCVSEGLAPASIMAHFRRDASHYTPPATNTVTVYSCVYDEESERETGLFSAVAAVPDTTVTAVPGKNVSVADGASADVPAIVAGFTVPGTAVDSTGGVWRCVGWRAGAASGAGAGASFDVSSDTTLVWHWVQVVAEEAGEDDPGGGGDVPEEDLIPVPPEGEQLLTIYSNDDGTLTVEAKVANGHKGYYYSLYAANELAGPWATVEKMQAGYEGDGLVYATADGEVDLAITFDPDEAKKFYKVVVDKEDPRNDD